MDFFKKASQNLGSGDHGGAEQILNMAQSFMASHKASGTDQATGAPTGSDPASYPAGPGVNAGATPPGVSQAGYSGVNAGAPASGVSQAGYSDVYSSAQTLYKGLNAKLQGKQSEIANEDLARAASDVLRAAEHYGLAKDSQYGQYIHKAEDFLDKHGRPRTTGTASGAPPSR